jgi:hypothetical protein
MYATKNIIVRGIAADNAKTNSCVIKLLNGDKSAHHNVHLTAEERLSYVVG